MVEACNVFHPWDLPILKYFSAQYPKRYRESSHGGFFEAEHPKSYQNQDPDKTLKVTTSTSVLSIWKPPHVLSSRHQCWSSLIISVKIESPLISFLLTAPQPKKTAVQYQCCQNYFQIMTKWCDLVLEVGWVQTRFCLLTPSLTGASYCGMLLLTNLDELCISFHGNRYPTVTIKWWKNGRCECFHLYRMSILCTKLNVILIMIAYVFARFHKLQHFTFNRAWIKIVCLSVYLSVCLSV